MKRAALTAALALFPLTVMGAIKAEPKSEPKAAPESELRPPRPGLPPPVRGPGVGAWVLAGAGTALLLTALLWPRHRHPAPPPDPFAVAQQELAALRSAAGRATPADLSGIVRRYAAGAFFIEGTGLTSEEVVSALVIRRKCPVEVTNAVWRFLSECDTEKFSPRLGNGAAEPSRVEALLADAAKLVDELEAARMRAVRTL